MDYYVLAWSISLDLQEYLIIRKINGNHVRICMAWSNTVNFRFKEVFGNSKNLP